MNRKYLILPAILLPIAILGSLWCYIHFGGEKVKEINPSEWIMKKPENVERSAILLQGPGNFRDVGKIHIDSRVFVISSALFRSDSPSKYTESDWLKLKKRGINLIIDLRSDKEAESDSYKPIDGIRYIRNPVYNEDPIRSVISYILFRRSKLGDMMANAYVKMVQDRAKSFGKSIELIAGNTGHGTIIHCTAGKDRTGILTAMILELLGVDRKAVLYDYSLSNVGFESNYEAFLAKDAPKLQKLGVPPDELKVLFMANTKWLEHVLDDITSRYGDMENYLIKAAGVDKASIDRLKTGMIGTDDKR